MIKAILFDIDGTIIDTERVIIETLQTTLKRELGLIVPAEDLTFVLGIPGAQALKKFTSDPAQLAQLGAAWSELAATKSDQYRLFPAMRPALTKLAALPIKLGVVTSKTQAELAAEFTPFGIDANFDVLVTASDTVEHKPNPAPLVFAAKQLKLAPDEIVYVGDTDYDRQAAKAAGMQFALAQWGSHLDPNTVAIDYVLATPIELLSLS